MPILDDAQIAAFFALEEVQAAKRKIDAKKSEGPDSVYFTVKITDTIKSVLKESFGLELSSATVPMRWIKGDIAPHVDVGSATFDTTHLLYLTDSPGELVLGGRAYPIKKGTAYTFPESICHETINTGLEPRLLLGPMSEQGFAVGAEPTPTPTPEPTPSPPCCARPTFRRGPLIDNATYTELVAGNTYIGSVRRAGVNISYAQIIAMKKAKASKS